MKKILLASLIVFGALGAVNAQAGVAVGVSVNVGDPNFYGAIDIGGGPPPQLLAPQPVVIAAAPGVVLAPIYLHVPPAHYANWRRYCGMYNACGRPVYFVHPDWYRNVYAPHYRSAHPVGPGVRHEEIRHEEVRHEEVRHEEHREQEHHDDHHDH